MNAQTERRLIDGPAGVLEVAIDRPDSGPLRGVALICHPHPLFAGTLDNKVVQTLARAHVQAGWTAWRFNVRGVGRSAGSWDAGRGEIDDGMAILKAADALDADGAGTAIAGFSFGGYLASQVVKRLLADGRSVVATTLIAPAVVNFDVPGPPANSLVVQGGADDVVPLDSVLAWAEPLMQPVVVLPGVGHFFHGQLALLKQIVIRHLKTLE